MIDYVFVVYPGSLATQLFLIFALFTQAFLEKVVCFFIVFIAVPVLNKNLVTKLLCFKVREFQEIVINVKKQIDKLSNLHDCTFD